MKARVILTFVICICTAHAGGIFAYKMQKFHSDEQARLLLYTSVEDKGPVTWVVSDGKQIRFEKHQPHWWVELPTALPTNLIHPHEVDAISAKVREIREFTARFPKATEASQSSLQLSVHAQEKLAAGHVRYDGTWITKEEYGNIVAEAKQREEMHQAALVKAREDRINMEEATKAKEQAAKEAIRFKRVQELEGEIQRIEAENEKLAATIREKFSSVSNLIIDHQP